MNPTWSWISRLIFSGTSFGPEKAVMGKVAAAKKTTGTAAAILDFQKSNRVMQAPSPDYHRETRGLRHRGRLTSLAPIAGSDMILTSVP
jgi:hypothetical protein